MKTIRYIGFILFFSIFALTASAQDAVVIDTGNFVRGTIQGTNYMTVALKKDDGSVAEYDARDVQEFLWNGVTYISKPFVVNNKTDRRFFKLVEAGSVNLYSMGGITTVEKKRRKFRFIPSIGIGIGTGGYGSGIGLGGGVSFESGRRGNDDAPGQQQKTLYYIEKPGTGDMLEITPDAEKSETNTSYIKNALLEKLSDDHNLAEQIKQMDSFNLKSIQSLVKTYNSDHQ